LENTFPINIQDYIINLQIENTDFLKVTRSEILPEYFSSRQYSNICKIIYNYFDKFKEAPREHFFDDLDYYFESNNIKKEEKELYSVLLTDINEIENVNVEWVLSQITKFIRKAKYKRFVKEFAEMVSKDNIDECESLMYTTMKSTLTKVERGVNYFDTSDNTRLIRRIEENNYLMSTGIPKLDRIIGGLERKTYVLIMAPEKGRKSWFLVHLGSQAILQGLKVAHFTFEMSSDKVEIRYDQNLMGLPKFREGEYTFRYLEDGIERQEKRRITKSIYDIGHVKKKRDELRRYGGGLRIQEYPTGTCTPMNIERDLDEMETYHNYVPDVIIVDYSGIMDSDKNIAEERHKINAIVTRLRGIAVERNMLVLDGYQASKQAQDKDGYAVKVLARHAQEDKRVTGVCDLMLTLASSKEEWDNRIMRVDVAASREIEGRKEVSICYNLDIGMIYSYEKPEESGESKNKKHGRRRK
jgi:replicative DNA helicase